MITLMTIFHAYAIISFTLLFTKYKKIPMNEIPEWIKIGTIVFLIIIAVWIISLMVIYCP